MMRWAMQRSMVLLSCLLATFPFVSAARPVSPSARVVALVQKEMKDRRIPGLQMVVVQNGRVVLSRQFGLANVEHHVPVRRDTLFSINSATKSFTGVALMQMVEARLIDLQAPISRYVDGLPVAWREIRVRQLLGHTSGLPNIVDPRGLIGGGDEAEAWAKVVTLPLEAPVGSRFAYNQTNYGLLGRAMVKLTGMPFERYFAERQFAPAGMSHTVFGDTYDVLANSATPYGFARRLRGQAPVDTAGLAHWTEDFPASMRTGAGIQTTAEDLAHWIMALNDGRLLKDKASLSQMWASERLNDGSPGRWSAGWPVIREKCHPAYAGIGGGRSAFFVYPEDHLAVVVLSNLVGASPEQFIDRIATIYVPAIARCGGSN